MEALVSSTGVAADIKRQTLLDHTAIIAVVGEIKEGDAQRFISEVEQADDEAVSVGAVELDSVGGNLFEGSSIAKVVRDRSLHTSLSKNATCASACFFVFAAGANKTAEYGSRLGVHAASSGAPKNSRRSIEATAAMGRIAEILKVPSAIIEQMAATPPNKMFWLTRKDFHSMGVQFIGGNH